MGWSVALDGDTIVAGAHQDNQLVLGPGGPGEAHVFTRNDGGWSEQQRLVSPQPADGEIARLGDGQILIAFLQPLVSGDLVRALAERIAGDGSAAIENAAFTVAGGRILRIGRRGELAVPAGAVRIVGAHYDLDDGIVDFFDEG